MFDLPQLYWGNWEMGTNQLLYLMYLVDIFILWDSRFSYSTVFSTDKL